MSKRIVVYVEVGDDFQGSAEDIAAELHALIEYDGQRGSDEEEPSATSYVSSIDAAPYTESAQSEPLYEKCAGCHLFIEENDAGEGFAPFIHLHRGDEADETIDESHEAEPSGMRATLATWRTFGPPEMRARFDQS